MSSPLSVFFLVLRRIRLQGKRTWISLVKKCPKKLWQNNVEEMIVTSLKMSTCSRSYRPLTNATQHITEYIVLNPTNESSELISLRFLTVLRAPSFLPGVAYYIELAVQGTCEHCLQCKRSQFWLSFQVNQQSKTETKSLSKRKWGLTWTLLKVEALTVGLPPLLGSDSVDTTLVLNYDDLH